MRQAADSPPGRRPEPPAKGPRPARRRARPRQPQRRPPQAAGVAEADLAAQQDLVRKKTGRQLGRELPGHLRTEILQLSRGRYRDDYARLIQLYFREIAVDAAKP